MRLSAILLVLSFAGAVRGGNAQSPESQPATPASAAAALNEARSLFVEGYYDRAAEAYAELAGDDAERVPATVGLAECHLQTGRYDEALEALDELGETGAGSARVQLMRARVFDALGRYEEAIASARAAIELDARLAPARLLLAERVEYLGRTDEAIKEYKWFDRVVTSALPEDAEALTAVGQGFYRFSVLTSHPSLTRRTRHVLSKLFQTAYEIVDRMYWPARVASADLLREKYNLEEAEEDYRAALAINSNCTAAHVGLGRIALEQWNFEEIERRAQNALDINSNSVAALNLLAAGKIVERRYDDAIAACRRVLEVNPNDIEALAQWAAAALCQYDRETADAQIARAEAINPRSALLHSILADALGGIRQFAEAERHYQLAIEYDPTASSPRAELGLMHMQWGDETKAREVLDAAWRIDPFNARTKNTLELLEEIESFTAVETDHFRVLFDKDKDGLLGDLYAPYLESIYQSVCDDFEAVLDRKTIIEIFPTHSGFGVRITGKPWIHTVGACTGWVIAVDAPRSGADLGGPYNLANVLRHEFTHTVTLAVTDNRIAHWYTEGLAVMEEDAPRSFDWMELLADAVRRNVLFTLESINWGFVRPRRPNDRQLAYAQSEWMCEYLVATHGYDVLNRILQGFREQKTQHDIFVDVVGTKPEGFDAQFREWARAEVAEWGFDLTPPEDVHILRMLALVQRENAGLFARLARAEYDAENWQRAMWAARTSVALSNEKNALGLEVLVKLLRDQRLVAADDLERAVIDDQMEPRARKLVEIDPHNWTGLKALATVELEREHWEEALAWLRRLHQACPMDPFAASRMAGILLKREDDDGALPLLLEVARTEEHNADVPREIAAIFSRAGRWEEARYWSSRALYIDPYSEQTREQLAEVYMRLNDTKSAAAQYETLCALAPHNAGYHADCALAYHKLGDEDKAREFARRAVALDPQSTAKALLAE